MNWAVWACRKCAVWLKWLCSACGGSAVMLCLCGVCCEKSGQHLCRTPSFVRACSLWSCASGWAQQSARADKSAGPESLGHRSAMTRRYTVPAQICKNNKCVRNRKMWIVHLNYIVPIISLNTHPHVIPNTWDLHLFSKHTQKYLGLNLRWCIWIAYKISIHLDSTILP